MRPRWAGGQRGGQFSFAPLGKYAESHMKVGKVGKVGRFPIQSPYAGAH